MELDFPSELENPEYVDPSFSEIKDSGDESFSDPLVQCVRCKENKLLSECYTNIDKRYKKPKGKYYKTYACKECVFRYFRNQYAENEAHREKMIAKAKAWNAKNFAYKSARFTVWQRGYRERKSEEGRDWENSQGFFAEFAIDGELYTIGTKSEEEKDK